jgi:DNA-binding response OmpR family regulator
MTSIAMIEDEVELRRAVRDLLQRYGFEILEGATIADARALAGQADLMLLDLGLPDGDGLSLCAELAESVPLIVLSARGDEADRVAALELGADDYLAKPFFPRELVARCHSVLRRHQRPAPRRQVMSADVVIDLDAFRVGRGSELIALTTKEIELMVCLAERIGQPVRRQDLAERVWGTALGYVNRSLDVHISSLRQKLGRRPDGEGYIDTVHGIGYRLQQ